MQQTAFQVSLVAGQRQIVDVQSGDPESLRNAASKVVPLIIGQAIVDQMNGVMFVREDGRRFRMMFGRQSSENAEFEWFEMTAPPLEAYDAIAQAIIGLTVFTGDKQSSGSVVGLVNGTPRTVSVTVHDWNKIQLSWDNGVAGGLL